jgi:hypothetical protein
MNFIPLQPSVAHDVFSLTLRKWQYGLSLRDSATCLIALFEHARKELFCNLLSHSIHFGSLSIVISGGGITSPHLGLCHGDNQLSLYLLLFHLYFDSVYHEEQHSFLDNFLFALFCYIQNTAWL